MSATEFNSIEIAPKNISSSPKHRAEARNNILAKVLVAGLVLSGVSLVPQFTQQVPSAQASVPTDSVALYLSAPMVQASDATGSVSLETFDAFSPGGCPTSLTSIRATIVESGDACRIFDPGPAVSGNDSTNQKWGGATTTSATPQFGGTPSRYMMVYSPRSITLTLEDSVKYVGFYWTSGGPGNQVSFYDASDRLIETFTTDDISTVLGSSNTSEVTRAAIGSGISHKQRSYFGDPSGHVSLTPTQDSTNDPTNIYTYLNLYVGGSIQVKKLVFSNSAGGFEFDNLTTSTDSQTPSPSMIKVSEKVSQAPLVPVSSSVGSVAAPTKVHTGTVPTNPKSGSTVSLFGANFGGVTEVLVAGTKVSIISTSPNQVRIRLPRGLTGEVDVELRSPLGTLKLAKHFNFGGKVSSGVRSAEVIVGGFDHNSRKLTARMKARIDRWLDRNSDLSKLTCTGFTSLPRRTTDVRLSTNRGTTACEYAKSKRPSITTSVSQGIEDPRPGSNVRRVRLVLTQ